MMKTVLRTLLFALVGLLLTSCFYLQKTKDNVTLSPSRIEGIEVGKTTIGEAFKLLGSPRRSIKLLEHEAYVFYHAVEKRTGVFIFPVILQRIDSGSDAVTLIVDREGIVQAIGAGFESEEASYGTPWGE